jgi:hypothetical protein
MKHVVLRNTHDGILTHSLAFRAIWFFVVSFCKSKISTVPVCKEKIGKFCAFFDIPIADPILKD